MAAHDLYHDFEGFSEKIHSLKTNDAHFKRLYDQYDQINHEVLRMESGVENVSDEILNQSRIRRVQLKDQLFEMLNS